MLCYLFQNCLMPTTVQFRTMFQLNQDMGKLYMHDYRTHHWVKALNDVLKPADLKGNTDVCFCTFQKPSFLMS